MKEVAINVQESLNLYNYLNKFIIWIFLFVIFFLSSGFALTVNEGTVFQTSNNSINYITAEDLTYLSNIDISENNITFQSNNGSVFYNKNESFVDYFLHDVLINFKSNLTERNVTNMNITVRDSSNDLIGEYYTDNKITSIVIIETYNTTDEGYSFNTTSDIDGNNYDTISLRDDSTWFAGHLKTTKDNEGNVLDTKYAYNGDYIDEYGLLYSAEDIIADDICPSGYHVSNKEDWEQMIRYVGGMDGVNDLFEEKNFSYEYAGYKDADGNSNYFGNLVFMGSSNEYDMTNITLYYFGQYATVDGGITVEMNKMNLSRDNYYSVKCVKDAYSTPVGYLINYSHEDYVDGNFNITFVEEQKTIDLILDKLFLEINIKNKTIYTNNTIVGECFGVDPEERELNYTYKWYKNGSEIIGVNTKNLSQDFFNKTDNIIFQCKIDNGIETLTKNTSNITVLNRNPDISEFSFDKEEYFANENITVNCSASDIDNDSLIYNYYWEINNVQKSSLNNFTTINYSFINKNDSVNATCVVNDGTNETRMSIQTTISNLPPEIHNVSIVSGENNITTHYSNQTLFVICNASDYDSVDNVSLDYSYTWYKNEELFINETSNNFLSNENFNTADVLSVTCMVNDGDYYVQQNSSSIVIVNTLPEIQSNILYSNATINETSDVFYSNQTITMSCSVLDYDNDTIEYNYRWYKNDTIIIGENDNTLTYDLFNKNDLIIGECNVSDGTGNVYLNSSEQEIQNVKPKFIEQPYIVSEETSSSRYIKSNNTIAINCTGSDYDEDELNYNYIWYKNDVIIAGENDNTLNHLLYDKNDNITSTCVVNDSMYSIKENSSEIRIRNTEPDISSVSIEVQEDDSLKAICIGDDYDEDELTSIYKWYKNDREFLSINSQTLDSGYYNDADTIIVECQMSDSENVSTALNSSSSGARFNFESYNKYSETSFIGYTVNITKNNVEINSTTFASDTGSLTVGDGGAYTIEMSHPNYITKTYEVDIFSAVPEIVNITYNTSEIEINFSYNNIKTEEALTNYTLNITNANTSTTTTYHINESYFLNLPLLADNLYNITIIKDKYLDFQETFIYDVGTEEDEKIFGSFYLTINVINEDTLEPFDFSYPSSAKFIINCNGEYLIEHEINTSINTTDGVNGTNILRYPVTCNYEKIRFETKYLEIDEITGETLQILPYRKLLMNSNEDLYDLNITVYLIDFTETSFVYSTFGTEDIINNYNDIEIYIKKLIEDEKVIIQSDTTDVSNKMGAYLMENDEYIIEIHSSNYPVKVIGSYSADESEDKLINLNDINIKNNPEVRGVNINMKIEENDTGSKEVVMSYYDSTNNTESVQFILYENTLSGSIFYESEEYTNSPYISEIRLPLNDFENTTIFAEARVKHNVDGEFNITKPLNADFSLDIGMNEYISQDFLNWFLLGLLIIIGLYSTIGNNWVSMAITSVGAMFILFGWLEISMGVLALAIIISIFNVFNGAIGGKN